MTDVEKQLRDVEQDYALRLKQYAPEAVSVLREIMADETNEATLRATVARVLIDLTHRAEETERRKKAAKPAASKG